MKVKHGLVYSSSSGNLSGGTVARTSKGGALFIRPRRKVSQRSPSQNNRALIKLIVMYYKRLSSASLFNLKLKLGSNLFIGKNGLTFIPSLFQLYWHFAYYLSKSGFGIIFNIQSIILPTAPILCSISAVFSSQSLIIAHNLGPSSSRVGCVFASPIFKLNSNFNYNSLVFLCNLNKTNYPVYNISTLYFSRFKAQLPSSGFIVFRVFNIWYQFTLPYTFKDYIIFIT
jgi:hypothetical protein